MSWDWEKLREQQQKQKQLSGKSGGGPGNGGGVPPQMDDLLEQFKKFKLPGGFLLVAIILVVLFGSSTFYTVGVGEVGVVQRFGEYTRQTQPGLHFKLPAGIEKVTLVNVKFVRKAEFGFESLKTSNARFSSNREDVSLMLTGDLNVALVPWIVQYRVSDPYKFLFKVDDAEGLLRDMAEATMRLVVGDRSVDEVIIKRDDIAVECREILQKELDHSLTGIKLVTIEMQKTNVPGPVQPSFNNVNKAEQEKARLILKAREEYNTVIPAARGKAEKTIKEAEGYALDRINRAEGDAARFKAIYAEYAKAKDVTKRRLYLEMMKELFPKLGKKYIIDSDQKNFLPLLNIDNQKGVIQ